MWYVNFTEFQKKSNIVTIAIRINFTEAKILVLITHICGQLSWTPGSGYWLEWSWGQYYFSIRLPSSSGHGFLGPPQRSGSIKPKKFRTFALIPPPKNYYRSFQPIVKPNNTTLAPPTRFPQSGIPPHVQIRNKLDPLPESNLTIKKKRPNTLSISKENINLVRSLPSFNQNDWVQTSQ